MVNINIEDIPVAQSRYVDVAEAARMLRPILRRAFPGVKFSVRIDRYSIGASISIAWNDGPTRDQVEQITNGFKGSRFDGMDDLQYGADSWYCTTHGARAAATWGTGDDRSKPISSRCCDNAELVHFGSGYVSTNRALSPKFTAQILTHVLDNAGLPADTGMDAELPERSFYWHGRYDNIRDGVYRASLKMVGPVPATKATRK